MLDDTVRLFLEKYNLLKYKNNIIVAFSGGYDSMCLLDIMKKISNKYSLNLIAVHLNHNWRGIESDKEEENCKKYCNDITFYSEKLPSGIPHTETRAREERYYFLKRCAKKFNSQIILTAHNANDNAETVIYRIIKGTGITGLEGIQENRDIFYRPLLGITRDKIEQYCEEHSLKPNNDSSNSNTKYIRNKIRHEILPNLYKINKNIINQINQLSESAKATNKIVQNYIKYLEDYCTNDFCNESSELQETIVHHFFRNANLDYDKKNIIKIVKFINDNKNNKSGKTISLTTDKWLYVNKNKIQVINKSKTDNKEMKITGIGTYQIANKIIHIKQVKKIPKCLPNDSDKKAYIELNTMDNLTIRTRKEGDIIQPLGLLGHQKLKKYFNNKGIPNHEKDDILLLCKDNEVLWVSGYGISDKIKIKNKVTHFIEEIKKG